MCGISQPALLPLFQHCSPGRLRAEPRGLAGSLCLQPLEQAREGAAEGVRLETGAETEAQQGSSCWAAMPRSAFEPKLWLWQQALEHA